MDVCQAVVHITWKKEFENQFPIMVAEFKKAIAQMNGEYHFPYSFAAINGS